MSRQEPLVSIITPARNAAAYIHETISTVTRQTYANWEWLVSDDNSTDSTVELLRHAAASDHRIKVLISPNPNGLPARARNCSLAAAGGEYLAFLDADDLWEPTKIERQVAYLRSHPEVDGVACLYDLFGDPARVQNESAMMWRPASPVCTRKEIIEHCPFQTSTLVIRRHCYEAIGGMNEDPQLVMEDYEYFVRLLNRFKIHRILEPLSHYRVQPLEKTYSGHALDDQKNRWIAFDIMKRKGLFTKQEAARRSAFLHYEEAKNNLFIFNKPFRRHLVKAMMTGFPTRKAVVMMALSFLPAPLLRKILKALLKHYNARIAS